MTDVIDEIRADHEKIEIRGELICAECDSPWPCAAERGAVEIAQLQTELARIRQDRDTRASECAELAADLRRAMAENERLRAEVGRLQSLVESLCDDVKEHVRIRLLQKAAIEINEAAHQYMTKEEIDSCTAKIKDGSSALRQSGNDR